MRAGLRRARPRGCRCAVGLALLLGVLTGCGTADAEPEIASPRDYHVVAPTVIAWQDGAVGRVLLTVAAVYPSKEDDAADRFRPVVSSVRADEVRLVKEIGLGHGNARRGDAPDGSRDELSGWTVSGLWRGRLGVKAVQRVSARVCWGDGGRCTRTSYGGCTADQHPGGNRVAETYTFNGTSTRVPAGARILYARTDSDGDGECGWVESTPIEAGRK